MADAGIVGRTGGGAIALRAARVALPEGACQGWVSIADGLITGVSASDPPAGVERIDLGGLDLIPALVDLHCDCIEDHAHPRPTAELPLEAALVSLDTELAAHGYGTAFVCVVLDEEPDRHRSADRAVEVVECIQAMHADLRVDMRVHLRVETCSPAAADAGRLGPHPGGRDDLLHGAHSRPRAVRRRDLLATGVREIGRRGCGRAPGVEKPARRQLGDGAGGALGALWRTRNALRIA